MRIISEIHRQRVRLPHAPSAETLDLEVLAEQLAYTHGQFYDSYLALEPGREFFWSHDRRGFVSFIRVGRHLEIGGGLIGPAGAKSALLIELMEYARERRLSLSFYNIGDEDLPLFRQFGFQPTKWGEEAVIDLREHTWKGKPFEWVRRQTNYCRRHGLVVSECRSDAVSEQEWNRLIAELQEVSNALVDAKPQSREMRFVEGRFDPHRLGRKRVFVARADHGAGRIEAFLVCNPFADGDQWAFEIYRHRPDAVRGTIAFLMHETVELLQEEKAGRVSLCLVPALRCGQPLPGDSPLARWGFVLSKHFNFIYDSTGLYHFKSRFRPEFENRYMCVWPKVTVGSAWAFIRLIGVFELSPLKIARNCFARIRKHASRATLPVPDEAGTSQA